MDFPIRQSYSTGQSSEYDAMSSANQFEPESCWLSPQSVSSHHNEIPRQVLQGLSFSKPVKLDTFQSAVQKAPSRTKRPPASAYEEDLVKRIHRSVGGAARLSTFDDPAIVRQVVIEALAAEQALPSDSDRVRRGQLSALERRAVRTVTNRGAAVRSRVRQRRELEELRELVHVRDGRVRHLEDVVRALCAAYAVPLPSTVPPVMDMPNRVDGCSNQQQECGFITPSCTAEEEGNNIQVTNCSSGSNLIFSNEGVPSSLLTDYARPPLSS